MPDLENPLPPAITKRNAHLTDDYVAFLAEVKSRIATARLCAARSVNHEMILLYWDIGCGIVDKQQTLGWGESVVERLAADLQKAFPGLRGYSARNLRDMKRLYLSYSAPEFWRQVVAKTAIGSDSGDAAIWQQAVAKLEDGQPSTEILLQTLGGVPWGQHLLILNKTDDLGARLYYLRATTRFGWSRSVLLNQIKGGAYQRAVQEKKTHNFDLALPEHLAEQADEMLKSRYNLEFLGIGQAMKERELEERLIGKLQQFILELGYGFCFVGRQYRLSLGRKEYFIDLLFYHRFLKALVAFDLKIGPFEPEHAGKMDYYLNLLNDRERAPDDRPSIGIVLCAEKDDVEVEYALKTKTNPIGVAEYHLQSRLPVEFKGRLPSAKQLADAVREALPA